MKKIVPLILLFSQIAFAQQIEVDKTTQLTHSENGRYAWVSFLNGSTDLLCSAPDFSGLYVLGTKDGSVKQITDKAGAGYRPAVSNNGESVAYRLSSFVNSRKHYSLQVYNFNSKSITQMEAQTRGLTAPVAANGKLHYAIANKKSIKPFGSETEETKPFVVSKGLKPILYRNNEATEYLPSGKGRYIWASVSPNGKMMVYNFNGSETLVADLNGNVLMSLGRLHAPKWLGNTHIIGMNDNDDGLKVLSSDIVAFSLKERTTQNLTNTPSRLETHPAVSADGSKIAFHTSEGEIFIMQINK